MTGPARIVVVEDEPHLATLLEMNLTSDGYAVSLAESLAQARVALQSPADLVLLDVMLPDGNGLDFCRELRQSDNRVPVLMLTALGSTPHMVEGLGAGADDYLSKPFSLDVLLARVAAILRRHRWTAPQPKSAVTFSDARLDFEARVATVRGQTVELTDLEWRLVKYFVDHEGRPVAREALLERVWGVSPDVSTRTVDNFVVRLRRVFEPDPAEPTHFQTVRGVGYRFVRR